MSERAKGVKLRALRVGQALTVFTSICLVTLVFGQGITYSKLIFDTQEGECSLRSVYALFFGAALIECYMMFQECCTVNAIKNDSNKYGCHKMSQHQFFMHLVAFGATLIGTIVNSIAHPNHEIWLVGIAGVATGFSGNNSVLRLFVIYYDRELAHHEMEKIKMAIPAQPAQ